MQAKAGASACMEGIMLQSGNNVSWGGNYINVISDLCMYVFTEFWTTPTKRFQFTQGHLAWNKALHFCFGNMGGSMCHSDFFHLLHTITIKVYLWKNFCEYQVFGNLCITLHIVGLLKGRALNFASNIHVWRFVTSHLFLQFHEATLFIYSTLYVKGNVVSTFFFAKHKTHIQTAQGYGMVCTFGLWDAAEMQQ